MLERLETLSRKFNVSGVEEQMRTFLADQLKARGIEPIIDETGCLYGKKQGFSTDKKKIIISAPMDVPGYLALYINKNTGFLVTTPGMPDNKTKNIKVLAEDGNSYHAILLQDSETDRKVHKKKIQLADAFRLDPLLKADGDLLCGHFVTTIARIQLLLDLTETDTKNDVVFLFTASARTRAAKEKNIARRLNPDFMIFLGAAESKQSSPLIALKDGSAFSNDQLINHFQDLQGKNSFTTALFSDPITNAAEVHSSEGIPFLSLVFPYISKEGIECFSPSSYNELLLGLKKFL